MQKIIPHLWFNDQAEEAVNFYISIFKNSKILQTSHYQEAGAEISGMKKDSIMTVDFILDDFEFIALNGGPEFSLTPAISFFVDCCLEEELDSIWEKLSNDGFVMMEFGSYPFGKKYGWVQDRYGVSWQVNLTEGKKGITPFLMFVGDVYGKAEEAVRFYTNIFNNSSIKNLVYHNEESEHIRKEDKKETVLQAAFTLEGQEFLAFDSGNEHNFTFTEAISFFVNCDTEEEVDRLWDQLTKDGDEQPCGWLKDRFGVSWQIVPTKLGDFLGDSDAERSNRVMEELLTMKKIDIKRLREVFEDDTK